MQIWKQLKMSVEELDTLVTLILLNLRAAQILQKLYSKFSSS